MPSFTLTSSTAVTTTQSLTAGGDFGFIGALASVVTGQNSCVSIGSNASGAMLVNNGALNALIPIQSFAGFRMVNAGLIAGESFAISESLLGDVTTTSIQNTGTIISGTSTAIRLLDNGASITNAGYISGASSAIQVGHANTADRTTIANSGTIAHETGTGLAINALGSLSLLNTGRILGSISGSTLDDIIDNRGGVITGMITLSTGDNRFRGGDLGELVTAGNGEDTLQGHGGDDSLLGGGGADQLFGGLGDDELSATSGNATLTGGAGDDTLQGGTGANQVFGGAGDDVLRGGDGDDDLFGGIGADTFDFNAITDSDLGQPADRIGDFRRGQDIIDLLDLPSTLTFAGRGALAGGGTTSVAWTKAGAILTVQVDTTGDGVADMLFHVEGAAKLTASDFIL